MNRQTFTWGRSEHSIRKTERWVEGLWILGLLLAAMLLFGVNLDSIPLQDWDEETVELAARQIQKFPLASWQWLYPTLPGESDKYILPLQPWLVAGAYEMGGVNPWTTRLPGAILAALSVPLMYGIGREIFPSRQSAIFSSLIYLTLFPLVYQGRLAGAEGTALCFVLLTMWCVLRSRRDFRWVLGAGIGLGLICLSKGIVLGMVLGAITFLFLGWDTPRLLTSIYWWLGLLLGCAPALAWLVSPLLQESEILTLANFTKRSVPLLWTSVNSQSRPFWSYLLEVFSLPWLVFWSSGLKLAWSNRNWSWAKLVTVWAGIYFLAIIAMLSDLPWYILPVYPALALATGAQLAEVWNWPSCRSYPRFWSIGLSLLAVGAVASGIYFWLELEAYHSLSVFFTSVALTMAISAILVARQNLQFIVILFWGSYVSLLLLISAS